MRFATYVWPGLVQVADRGSWFGLAAAVGFAVMVNLALASTFVWRELLPHGLRNGIWITLGVFWLAAAAYSTVWRKRQAALKTAGPAHGETLEEAVSHYLQGNWFETERILVGLLHFDGEDVEARLLLATLLRRRRRWQEASAQLDEAARLERATKWELELQRERFLLKEAWEEFEIEEQKRLTPETDVPSETAEDKDWVRAA